MSKIRFITLLVLIRTYERFFVPGIKPAEATAASDIRRMRVFSSQKGNISLIEDISFAC
jgi:hypothetical protein